MKLNTQNLIRGRFAFLLLLAMSMDATSAYSDVVVIVSAQSEVQKMSAEQVERIYLGKSDMLPDRKIAFPIDQPEGSRSRNEFYAKIVHKNAAQLAAYWARIIFIGDGHPPQLLEGDLAVREAVASNADAIGYIDKSKVDSSVRVVLWP